MIEFDKSFIEDLVAQKERINAQLKYYLSFYDIECTHCTQNSDDLCCGNHKNWPLCFQPNEEWRKKHE